MVRRSDKTTKKAFMKTVRLLSRCFLFTKKEGEVFLLLPLFFYYNNCRNASMIFFSSLEIFT